MNQKYIDTALLYLAKQKVWTIIGNKAETMLIGWELNPKENSWEISYNDKPIGAFVTKKDVYAKAEQLEESEASLMKLAKYIDESKATYTDLYQTHKTPTFATAPKPPKPPSESWGWGGFDLTPYQKTKVQPKSMYQLYSEPKPCPKRDQQEAERWAKMCAEYPTDPAIAQIQNPKAKASANVPADPEPSGITNTTSGFKLYQWVKDDFVPYEPPPTKDDE